MRYLVTGGCGFIGSHICEALLGAGHSVAVLDDLSSGKRENLQAGAQLTIGDIRSKETIRELMRNVEGCFHLAAIASVERSRLDWLGTHSVNLSGTINIFDAAASRKIPVVYASSAAVYGNPNTLPIIESTPTVPINAYGADKLGCELHARVAGLIHNVPTMGLRLFNIYGPRQDPSSMYSGVISIFARLAQEGKQVTIHGDGQQTRDFVYVGDVVKAFLAGMERASTQAPVVNVCTGKPTGILELVATIDSTIGTQTTKIFTESRQGDIKESLGDPAQLRTVLGVTPEVSLSKGLRILLGKA